MAHKMVTETTNVEEEQILPKDRYIACGMPTAGTISTYTTTALLKMGSLNMDLITATSCLISLNRNIIVQRFLDTTVKNEKGEDFKYTHLFFLDSDMTVPDNLPRLLASNEDIISGLYYGVLISPVTETNKVYGTALDFEGKYINKSQDKVVEAQRVPTGCLLVKREVFEKMPYPWFIEDPGKKVGESVGEDYNFSEKARALGYKVHVDCGVPFGHLKTCYLSCGSSFELLDKPQRK